MKKIIIFARIVSSSFDLFLVFISMQVRIGGDLENHLGT